MKLRGHQSAPFGAIAWLMIFAIMFLPGGVTTCMALGSGDCYCCVQPTVSEDTCCADEPVSAPDQAEACCIHIDTTPLPLLSPTTQVPSPDTAGTAFLLPVHESGLGHLALSALPADRPPPSAPAHIQFCCPLA